MQNTKKIFITFDIDAIDYISDNEHVDEFNFLATEIEPLLSRFGIHSTFFIRLDKDIESKFGSSDYFFRKYYHILDKWKAQGHAIGWHPHFINSNDQNTNENVICDEIDELFPIVKSYELFITRIGWGFMTNKIMHMLDEKGFYIDSSAIPRPIYSFEQTKKDWSITPNAIYHPSLLDYRIPSKGGKELNILEYPISTFSITAPYDTEKVIRYCNIAFFKEYIENGITNILSNSSYLMTITHPYEIMPNRKHGLISFDILKFYQNLEFLFSFKNCSFESIR